MANMFFFFILLKNDKDLNLSKRVDQKLEAEEAERKICWWCTCSRSSLVRRILPAGLSVSSSPPAPAALHVSHMSSWSLRVQRFLYIERFWLTTQKGLFFCFYGIFLLTIVWNKVWKCSWNAYFRCWLVGLFDSTVLEPNFQVLDVETLPFLKGQLFQHFICGYNLVWLYSRLIILYHFQKNRTNKDIIAATLPQQV